MSKKIIYGDTVGTPMPRSDWAEKNERSAAYIKNKPKTIEKLDESDGYLIYDGKKIIDSSIINIVESKNELKYLEYDDSSLLCYVTTDRIGITPITLEAGVQYGGIGSNADHLYFDPIVRDLFPCEPFTIVTEKCLFDEPRNMYIHYEISTDGETYFYIASFVDDQITSMQVFNHTSSIIELNSIEFPSGYSTYSWRFPDSPPVAIEDYGLYSVTFDIYSLKFKTDEHFFELQKIFSAAKVYEYTAAGLYYCSPFGWEKVGNDSIKIELNSVTEKAHTHDVSDDDNGNVTINLASSNSGDVNIGGGDIIIGGNGNLETQSLDVTETEPMKTLTIDNSTYEIVDNEARERLTAIENQAGGNDGLPVAYINENGELIFEIGNGVIDAWINERGELEVELV